MINSEHAAKRIAQLSGICLSIFEAHEQEALRDQEEAIEAGFEIELKPVGIPTVEDTVYSTWHKWIQFYSEFL